MDPISTAVTLAWPLLFNPAQFGNGSGYRAIDGDLQLFMRVASLLPLKAIRTRCAIHLRGIARHSTG